MKIVLRMAAMLILTGATCSGQTSFFNQGFLRQGNAALDRAYLGIGTNGGGGSGTVSNFTAGNANPLFTTMVTDPTGSPNLSFTLLFTPFDSASFTAFNISNTLGNSAVFHAIHADSLTGGYVQSVTNAGRRAGDITLIATSNQPIVSLKALRAGTGVSISDTGTNVQVDVTSSGATGIDIPMTTTVPYLNNTNFFVDFNWPAQTLVTPTNMIVFNYSTNYGLANTSRVATVFIPQTNFGRLVIFKNQATNWHSQPNMIYGIPMGYSAKISFQQFGPGETNVTFTPFVDNFLTGSNVTTSFNPTNIGNLKMWVDGSLGVYQDERLLTKADDGISVRGWRDLGTNACNMTNNSSLNSTTAYKVPNSAPFNVPCVFFTAGKSWLRGKDVGTIAQPAWVFMMFYGRGTDGNGTSPAMDGNGSGNRFYMGLSQGGQNMQIYCGVNGFTAAGPTKPAWVLYAFQANGASSIMRTNGVQAATGNAGVQTTSQLTIAGDFAAPPADNQSSFYIAEAMVYGTNLTSQQITNVENYFFQKYPQALLR